MYVNARDHIQKSLFWYGYYEKNASLLWQRLIQPNSFVIDVGANIGYFSLLAAASAKKGKVLSFEPVSIFRDHMQRNLALNNIRHVELLPYCVRNENGWTEIFVAGDDNLGMSGLQPPENFSGKKEKVECITLDDWLKNSRLPRVDLVKIDVEGAEKNALEGMLKTLQKDQPVIFIEIIDSLLSKFSSSASDIYTALSQLNYQAYEIVNACTLKQIHHCKEGYDIVFIPTTYHLPAGINVYS